MSSSPPRVKFLRDPRISPTGNNNRSLTLNSVVGDNGRDRGDRRINTMDTKDWTDTAK